MVWLVRWIDYKIAWLILIRIIRYHFKLSCRTMEIKGIHPQLILTLHYSI